jgi:hypothetical protein
MDEAVRLACAREIGTLGALPAGRRGLVQVRKKLAAVHRLRE